MTQRPQFTLLEDFKIGDVFFLSRSPARIILVLEVCLDHVTVFDTGIGTGSWVFKWDIIAPGDRIWTTVIPELSGAVGDKCGGAGTTPNLGTW